VFIHCQALGDNEFGLEVFDVGVIEAELALQSAIGDTATVAEQLNDLIDDLVKVHVSPPQASPRRACRSAVSQHTKIET
jgi:alkanesulfonate monooxygenase SsuD/methylene tetrahydromethanopterin reductase-like flavin-dependent oxidoreductase (luciferase family)